MRARYDPMDLFTLVPALGMTSDPMLTHLGTLLEDDVLFRTFRVELEPIPACPGRRSPLDSCGSDLPYAASG